MKKGIDRKFLGILLIFALVLAGILTYFQIQQRKVKADSEEVYEKYGTAKSIADDDTWRMLSNLRKELDDIYSKYGDLFFTHPDTGEILPLIGDFNDELESVLKMSEEDILKACIDPKEAQSLIKFKHAATNIEEAIEDIYIRAFGRDVYDLALSFREEKLNSLVKIFHKYGQAGLYGKLKEYDLGVQLLANHTARPGNDVFIISKRGSVSLDNLLTDKHILSLSETTGKSIQKIEKLVVKSKRLEKLISLRKLSGGIFTFCACAGAELPTIQELNNQLTNIIQQLKDAKTNIIISDDIKAKIPEVLIAADNLQVALAPFLIPGVQSLSVAALVNQDLIPTQYRSNLTDPATISSSYQLFLETLPPSLTPRLPTFPTLPRLPGR